jgi:hypothetical protein
MKYYEKWHCNFNTAAAVTLIIIIIIITTRGIIDV